MGATAEGTTGSLDIIARTPELSLLASGEVREGEDVQLSGVLADPVGGQLSLPTIISMDWSDLANAPFEPVGGSLILYGEDSRPLAAIGDYSHRQVLEGRYDIHAGSIASEHGHLVDIIAVADPVPVVVVGGAMVAAGCLLGGGISWVIEWAQSRMSQQAADCKAQGGYPKVQLQFKWSFSLRRHEFGCTAKPKFRCETVNGELMHEEEGEEESVHALIAGQG
jgi:hypothetical protein